MRKDVLIVIISMAMALCLLVVGVSAYNLMSTSVAPTVTSGDVGSSTTSTSSEDVGPTSTAANTTVGSSNNNNANGTQSTKKPASSTTTKTTTTTTKATTSSTTKKPVSQPTTLKDNWSTATAVREILSASYSKAEHASNFSNPTARYRLNFMRHEYVSSKNPTPVDYIAMGAGGVVSNDPQTDKFLQYKPTIKKTSDLFNLAYSSGMNIWIYDENGFPSGAADGLVLKDNPEYESEGISLLTKTGSGKQSVTWTMPGSFEKIVTAYAVSGNTTYNVTVSGNTVKWSGVNGSWTIYMIVSSRMYENTVAMSGGYNRGLPNLLRKDAVGKFIEVGYQYYADNIKNFSDIVTAFFTDEPTLPEAILNGSIPYAKVSWSTDVEARFKEMHGYSLKQHYHSLFNGDTAEDITIRCNYRQTLASLFAENYSGQIAAWGKKNGVLTSGHLNMEEHLLWHVPNYGDMMQALKAMGAPGGDMLTGKYSNYMSEAQSNWFLSNHFMGGKYVGSAARVAGKDDYVMVEFCPTDTWEGGAFNTKNDIFAITNMLYMAGYNHINSYTQYWVMHEQNGPDYYEEYLDYVGRMTYMMRNSDYDGRLGVYYPIETMQGYFKAMNTTLDDATSGKQGHEMQKTLMTLTKSLWKQQMDYTFIDAQSILDAKISGKTLIINDAKFECIMMPRTEVLSVKVLAKLQQWEKSGGKLIWIEEKPHIAAELGKNGELQSAVSSVRTVNIDQAISTAASALNEKMKITSATAKDVLYMTRHTLQNKQMYYFVNGGGSQNTIKLSYAGANGFDVYNPSTGSISSYNGSSATVNIGAYKTVFVVVK